MPWHAAPGVCRMGEVCATYPAGVRVRDKSTGLDFRFFEFCRGQRVVLTAFMGDRPDTDLLSKPRGSLVRLGGSCTLASYPQADGRECLVDLGENRPGERYVHFWYGGLSEGDVKLADGIIASLRLCGASARDTGTQ
jgi:hypothetical protein